MTGLSSTVVPRAENDSIDPTSSLLAKPVFWHRAASSRVGGKVEGEAQGTIFYAERCHQFSDTPSDRTIFAKRKSLF